MHADAGDTGLTRGLGRYPGEGNGNPLQHSFLGNPKESLRLQSVELQSQMQLCN